MAQWLSSGFAILVSQWFGAKQYDRMRHYVAMSVILSAVFAVVMTAGLSAANEPILRLMNYSEELLPDVKSYMGIIYAGLIVTAAYNALAAFLRALGDSRSPLYFLIISAVINVQASQLARTAMINPMFIIQLPHVPTARSSTPAVEGVGTAASSCWVINPKGNTDNRTYTMRQPTKPMIVALLRHLGSGPDLKGPQHLQSR